jgi:hypothetical protein
MHSRMKPSNILKAAHGLEACDQTSMYTQGASSHWTLEAVVLLNYGPLGTKSNGYGGEEAHGYVNIQAHMHIYMHTYISICMWSHLNQEHVLWYILQTAHCLLGFPFSQNWELTRI